MSPWTSKDPSEKAKDILRYFLQHPEAVADLEGVARWRLLEETVHRRLEETEEALGWLIHHRYLLQESTTTSGRLFRLNPHMTTAAESLLGRRRTRELRRRRASPDEP